MGIVIFLLAVIASCLLFGSAATINVVMWGLGIVLCATTIKMRGQRQSG